MTGKTTIKTNQMKKMIFIVIIALILLAVYAFISFKEFFINYFALIAAAILIVLVFYFYDVLIQLEAYERAVVMRFGRFNRVSGPGWFFMIPFIETFKKVDLRVQTIDVPPQNILTTENIEIKVDALIFMKVGSNPDSVKASVLNIQDYKEASKKYIVAAIRDVVGLFPLNKIIANVDEVNKTLYTQLESVSKDWGIQVDKVQIQDISIPKTVLDAMHGHRAAEQEKKARLQRAEASKAEILAVREAAAELDDKALSYYYIKALEKMSEGKATKMIFPMELSRLASSISSKLASTSIPEKKKIDAEQFIKEHNQEIASLFGKELSEKLLEVVKEETKKKPVEKNA